MATSTLRPNSTITNTGAVTGAGGDLDTALSDDSDASYVTLDPDEVAHVGVTDFAFPAGAVVISLVFRARTRKVSGSTLLDCDLFVNGDAVINRTTVLTWLSATTHTIESIAGSFTDAEIDGAELRFQTRGGNPSCIVIEAYLDVVYVPKPVTNATFPTGTLTEDNQPLVEWTNTLDSEGGAQTHFEVKVFDDATYLGGGFDPDISTPDVESGEVASAATNWDVTKTLPNDTYRAYVRVAQTVNGELHWSNWDFEGFVVNTPLPANPILGLTGQDSGGRIMIEIEAGVGGAVSTDLFEVQRSDDGGVTWVNVRTEDGDGRLTPAGGEASAFDYEARNGVATFFRARAVHSFSESESYSAWVQDSETWSSRSWWIKHPAMPGLNYEAVRGQLTSYPGHQRSARQGVHHPLGRTFPIVVTDTRGPKTGTLVVRVDTDEEREGFDALMEHTLPMLVQGPASEHEPDRWVVFGDLERQRVADKSWISPTNETLAWIEVGRPTDEQMIETFGVGLFPSDNLYPAL